MADSTLDSELFVLKDNWPGYPTNRVVPYDFFTSSAARHNVATRDYYEAGTKAQVVCDGTTGQPGLSTLIYLQVGTQNPDVAIAAKTLCVPDSATLWYQLTNDPDDCIQHTGSLLLAIALSAMTDLYWGWFWCDGVCPEQYISGLGGNYLTVDLDAAGPIGVSNMGADSLGLSVIAADTSAIIGFALAADA